MIFFIYKKTPGFIEYKRKNDEYVDRGIWGLDDAILLMPQVISISEYYFLEIFNKNYF